MTKLNAEQFLHVFRHSVEDVEDMLGLDRSSLMGDYEVVSRSVKSRGLSVLLIDLPSECSALEKALDSGIYVPRLGAVFTKSGYPSLFRPVYDLIFTEQWVLRESVDPLAVRCLRQLLKQFKKYRTDSPPDAKRKAIDAFSQIEEELPSPVLSWGDSSLFSRRGFPCLVDLGSRNEDRRQSSNHELSSAGGLSDDVRRDLSCIQFIADYITRGFVFDWKQFQPKHGPGAVSEKFRESKYEFPTWPERLERWFPYDTFGMINHFAWSSDQYSKDASPAKLIDVPKDYKGPRLIASEPISSQFIQQGFIPVLRENVKRSVLRNCIDFKSQEPSRALALSASKTRDLATIDLSSASDRLSCALVECIFRRNFHLLELLNAARTHEIIYPDGRVQQMKKFAAQGAAFTFPVQTIVYAIICIGVLFSRRSSAKVAQLAREVRVYGDDMIVPVDVFPHVSHVLEVLSLKVNQDKSFSKGSFRESCGMDAYDGHDVTVASVREFFDLRSPMTLESVVECSNNLYIKGFIRSSSALLDFIPWKIRKNIPQKSSVSTAFGLLGAGKPAHKKRYNALLHRTEVKVLCVATKVTKTSIGGHYRLFQWFVENPRPDTVWTSGEVSSVKARYCLRWVDQQTLV